MKITLREDLDPDTDFYYDQQFKIYHEPYLIWDKETWQTVLTTCNVYRIEVNPAPRVKTWGVKGCGVNWKYTGDVILEDKGKGTKYIVDFSVLPEYQGKGIGKAVFEQVKMMGRKLTAVTRKETLDFFLKSGFDLKKTIKNYYHPGVDGYYNYFLRKDRELEL
jgi:ribosomal protein S18 acetylase RimI-like enzyme